MTNTNLINTQSPPKTNKWLIFIPYATLIISVYFYIRNFIWGGVADSFKLGLVVWPICTLWGILLFINSLRGTYTFLTFFAFYSFYYVFCVFIAPEVTTNLFITECVYGLLLFSLTVLFTDYTSKHGIVRGFSLGICIAIPLTFTAFLELVNSLNTSMAKTYNPVFYLLYFLPFAFLEKKAIIKYTELAIIFISIILSYKRTALISFAVIAIFVFYRVNKEALQRKKGILKVFILTVVLCFGVYFIFTQVVLRNSNLDWVDRLNSMETGGGRLERWDKFFDDMGSASFLQIVFGHGVETPYYHNDLMQVIYNSGIIGGCFYIGMCVQLVLIYINMARLNYTHTTAFGTSLIIFFLDSIVGQVIVVHTWTLQLVVFWGIILGDFYRERKLRRSGNIDV